MATMATAQQPTLVLTDTRSNIFTICLKKVGDSPGLFLFVQYAAVIGK